MTSLATVASLVPALTCAAQADPQDVSRTPGAIAGKWAQIGIVQIVAGTLTLKTNTVGTPLRPTDFKPQPWYALIEARKTGG